MTAYQLDPGDLLSWGGWVIPQPWADQLVPDQIVDVEINGRPARARVRVVRDKYAIADEVRPNV